MSILAVVGKPSRVLQWRSLTLDLDQHSVHVAGAAIPVSRSEFAVLRFLITSRNVPMPKQAILTAVFGPCHGRNPLQADMFVARLRRSLALAGLNDAISTVVGRGYAVLDDQAAPRVTHELPRADRVMVAA